MHYLAFVVIPPEGDAEELVGALMAPWDENRPDISAWYDAQPDDWEGESPFDVWWDWWVIGGRWTGHLSQHYNPETDPENLGTCSVCSGTGNRDWGTVAELWDEKRSGSLTDWITECRGCNGCGGTGMTVKWPTQWRSFNGDVVTVAQALAAVEADPDLMPYRIVAGETVVAREYRNPEWRSGDGFASYWLKAEDFDKTVREALERADPAWRVAVVDYHC